MIEKFNRDVVQLIAKMCPSTGKKPDAARSYVTATAVEAHNAAIHNPLSQGSLGVTPSEVMHGVRPLLQDALTESHIQDSIAGADPGLQQHLEAVAGAHNKAREYAMECRAAYEQRLCDDARNVIYNKKSIAHHHWGHSTSGTHRLRKASTGPQDK